MPKRGLDNDRAISTPTVSRLPNISGAARRVGVLVSVAGRSCRCRREADRFHRAGDVWPARHPRPVPDVGPDGAGVQDQPSTLDPYIPGHSASFLAVQCVDSDYPRDQQAYTRLIPVEDRRQPYFGLTSLFDMAQCIAWPAADCDRYLGPWNHRGRHPILVVNNRYDPETPVWNGGHPRRAR